MSGAPHKEGVYPNLSMPTEFAPRMGEVCRMDAIKRTREGKRAKRAGLLHRF